MSTNKAELVELNGYDDIADNDEDTNNFTFYIYICSIHISKRRGIIF